MTMTNTRMIRTWSASGEGETPVFDWHIIGEWFEDQVVCCEVCRDLGAMDLEESSDRETDGFCLDFFQRGK